MTVEQIEIPDQEDVFFYLDALRDSGEVNMFGARPHLMENFPTLTKDAASALLMQWMKDGTRHA